MIKRLRLFESVRVLCLLLLLSGCEKEPSQEEERLTPIPIPQSQPKEGLSDAELMEVMLQARHAIDNAPVVQTSTKPTPPKPTTTHPTPPSPTTPSPAESPVVTTTPPLSTPPVAPQILQEQFSFKSSTGEEYNLTLKPQSLQLQAGAKPLIVLHLFDKHHGMDTYLPSLQKRYAKVMTLLTLPLQQEPKPKAHWISYSPQTHTLLHTLQSHLAIEQSPLPLTLLYYNGTYRSDYKGEVPIEMLTHDIEMIIKH